jgi:GNAT superfamily N-acetyltransferase
LDIQLGEDEAYMFDMYVTPDSRGKVAAGYLLSNALQDLKDSGFTRVYGFYEKDNLPALWIHRLFGYRELGKRKVSRLLLYRKSEALPSGS